jgi:hypothetical protein
MHSVRVAVTLVRDAELGHAAEFRDHRVSQRMDGW